jgi:hypothetical protein
MVFASEPPAGARPSAAVQPANGRLADQLHAIAAVTETLTYRLLDLEERLGAQERRLETLLQDRGGWGTAAAEGLEQRCGETEDRLGRVEALLAGLERPGAGRHLQALQRPRPSTGSGSESSFEDNVEQAQQALLEEALLDEELEVDPFFDEGEQPFMDERTA